MLTAAQILAAKSPGDLFTNPSTLKGEYLILAKQYHPDNGGDPKVMQHINMLHQQAQSRTIWTSQSRVVFGNTAFAYTHSNTFELGTMYYAKQNVVYVLDDKYSSQIENAIQVTRKISLPYPELDRYVSRTPQRRAETVISYTKEPDAYLLRHCPVNKDPRHIAWVLNRIYDLVCSLHHGGTTHNNLSLDSIFISPENHTAYLYGYFYAAPVGHEITHLPRVAFSVVPPDMKITKRAAKTLDLAMVKALGRELAGDRTGMSLPSTPTNRFLRSPTTGSAVEDYQGWSNALTAEFGPKRTFHPMGTP